MEPRDVPLRDRLMAQHDTTPEKLAVCGPVKVIVP